MSQLCRRCRRPVAIDAVVCDYCELENPLQDATRGEQERVEYLQQMQQAEAAKKARVLQVVGISLALIVLAAAGLYVWREMQRRELAASAAAARAAAAAPACDGDPIKAQALGLVIENALVPLPPGAKSQLPQSAFKVAEVVERPTSDETMVRHCEYSIVFTPPGTSAALVANMATSGITSRILNAGEMARVQHFLTQSWINSRQQVEWYLRFDVARDDAEVGKPWVVNIPEEFQTSLEDAVLTMSLIAEVSNDKGELTPLRH